MRALSNNDRELLARIENFIRSSRRPVVVEPGAGLIPIRPEQMELSGGGTGVRLHIWNESANLIRRVVAIRREEPGRMELEVERFGHQRGAWLLIDQARASNHRVGERLRRSLFAEEFRAYLHRQFPGWDLRHLTAAPDLEHSLSPAYPRALVTKGSEAWAAIAAPTHGTADGALTFGLIWLDYLRRRASRHVTTGLAVFLPSGSELATCLRLRWLNPNAASIALFTYDADGYEHPLDSRQGNLVTALEPASESYTPVHTPEGRIEALLRRDLTSLDGTLLQRPVYGQVPAFAGQDRGVLDLLGIDSAGRLAVLELKASEDVHLPLQALDYWMRVAWHLEQGDFERYGYFPGLRLSRQKPRMLLVSPALDFHPSTETLLRYFSPEVEVERIGLASEPVDTRQPGLQSRKQIRVAFRLHGWREPWYLNDGKTGSNGGMDERDPQLHPAAKSG